MLSKMTKQDTQMQKPINTVQKDLAFTNSHDKTNLLVLEILFFNLQKKWGMMQFSNDCVGVSISVKQ